MKKIALAVMLIAAPAGAQDFAIHSYATQETLLKPGANRTMIFGARAVAKYTLGTIADRSVRIYGRAQASAVPDGGAKLGSVTIENLESYQSLELVGGIELQGYGDFYVTAFAGTALQIESGRPQAIQNSPLLLGAGIRRSLRYTEEPGWVYGGVCVNQALGKNTPVACGSAQLPLGNLLGGKLSVIGDAYGPGEKAFGRVGIAYQF